MANSNGKPRKKDSARLIWDSKPRRAPNPKDIEFQISEVVIPNPQHAGELPLSFRDGLFGEEEIDKQKVNRLIWGDNLLAMQALLTQGYEEKINLIYIDPPFDSKADYSHKILIDNNQYTKKPSIIERLAYKDTWIGGTDSYLDMLYPRLQLMRRLLSESGVIFLHIGTQITHYVKVLMDEIFGKDNYRNEISVKRIRKSYREGETIRGLNVAYDTILLYAKSEKTRLIPPIREEATEERWHAFDAPNIRPNLTYELFGVMPPPGRCWMRNRNTAKEMIEKGTLRPNSRTGKPEYMVESTNVVCDTLWTDISAYSFKTGFDTEKSHKLINRIFECGLLKKDSIIADFFCGSGSTSEVAEELGVKWIGCELGKVGIQITRSRMVDQGAKPFIIENIGNYQREMIYLTGGRIWEMQHLILKLFGATPRDKMSGLGVRHVNDTEELVYVGYPDRPIAARKAEELAVQAQKLDGRGYKKLVILGWDYEYNYHQALESRINALKGKLKVQIESRDIPPDIYDYLKKAKSEDEIEALADKVKFYERPYLRMEKPKVKSAGKENVELTLAIKRYVLMDIPLSRDTKKEQETYQTLLKLTKDDFAVLIDYWAIDWNYDGFTFKSQWQAFRGNGKKAKTVPIEATETIEKRKKRIVAVRVVDIFGNDAGAIIEIN